MMLALISSSHTKLPHCAAVVFMALPKHNCLATCFLWLTVGLFVVFCVQCSKLASTQKNVLYKSEYYFFFSGSDQQVTAKVCYVEYEDSTSAGVSLHLTNTVFIDRALIVVPVMDGK